MSDNKRYIGGFNSSTRPDESNTKAGKGQELLFLKNKFTEEDFDEEDIIPDRPEEQTLRRLTTAELLPPPSDMPISLDNSMDPDLPEFVTEQRIEFLVMERQRGKILGIIISVYINILGKSDKNQITHPLDRPEDPWGFPNADTLQALYDKVRLDIDHIQIMDVVLWSRWDKSNGVATIMMSTINLALMEKVYYIKTHTYLTYSPYYTNILTQYKLLYYVKNKSHYNLPYYSKQNKNKENLPIYPINISNYYLPFYLQARHVIRTCTTFDGKAFQTYNKRQFVKRFGITMYVTKDNANLPIKRIMRSLFYKNPAIKSAFEAIHVSRFTDNPPGFNPARRSRIGDVIYLLDSPTLADKLRAYPEDYKFQCGGGFTVTLKGGIRGPQQLSAQFTQAFSSSVMMGSAAEAMQNAQKGSGAGGP